jgi:hypothetical protein
MNRFEYQLRIAAGFAEFICVGQSLVHGGRTQTAEHWQPGKKIIDGLGVIHIGKSIKKGINNFST